MRIMKCLKCMKQTEHESIKQSRVRRKYVRDFKCSKCGRVEKVSSAKCPELRYSRPDHNL